MPIRGEAWKQMGKCRSKPQSLFFPEKRKTSTERLAKTICEECPVRIQCYRFAMLHDEVGIWGGTSDSERNLHKTMIEMSGFTVEQYLQSVPPPPPVEVEITFNEMTG